MTKTIKNILAGLLVVPVLALGVSAVAPIAQPAMAQTAIEDGVLATNDGTLPQQFDGENGIFKQIVNILLYIIGAIAVIMLIIGGIRYTISGGDSSAVTGAKNTILYAIIGIIVAMLAFVIVNFVIGRILNV